MPRSHVGRDDTPWSSTFRHYPLPISVLWVYMHHLLFGFQFTCSFSSYESLFLVHLSSSSNESFFLVLFDSSSLVFIGKYEKDFNLFTIFIWESCDWGNLHFCIVPMGKVSRGRNCLIENAIQNKHWAGKAGELWKLKNWMCLCHF